MRLLKLVREKDKPGVRSFLSSILRRNLMTYDLSASGVKGLTEELYYAIVHVARIVVPSHAVRRLGDRLTLEEVFAHCGQELEIMMDEPDSSASAGGIYDEMAVSFITGTTPLDEFDSYLEALDRMNLPQILEIKKAQYSRYQEALGE